MATAYDSLAITNLMREKVAAALINEGIEASANETLYILTDKIIAALGTAVARALANDTVSAQTMLQGVTAHNCYGNLIVGTIEMLAAATYIPTTVDQIIEAGKYIEGIQTIKGVTADVDANILPENIRAGVQILGVNGSCQGTYAKVTSITLNVDGSMHIVDDNGIMHTLVPTYIDNAITSIRYDEYDIPVLYKDGALISVGDTAINGGIISTNAGGFPSYFPKQYVKQNALHKEPSFNIKQV